MKWRAWLKAIIFTISLLVILVVLLTFIAQSLDPQQTVRQGVLNPVTSSENTVRGVFLFVMFLGSGIVIYIFNGKVNSRQGIKWALITALVGLIIGLLVFYAQQCCESLVTFYLGFPLIWLVGITKEGYGLSVPPLYLSQNLTNMYKWIINPVSLFVDVAFWYFVGLAGYMLTAKGSNMQVERKGADPIGQESR